MAPITVLLCTQQWHPDFPLSTALIIWLGFICDVNLHALGIFIRCCLLLEAVINNVGGSGRWFTGFHFFIDNEHHHRLQEEVDSNYLKSNLTQLIWIQLHRVYFDLDIHDHLMM